ncbi:hypothetical protein [Spartinivicinus ruber]|uniref:hypothetical protein n=1 Tax=Spartinivicinus ruber TaxID=2683272 RepID=UPI0013D718FC|nr:hypothetical protein [Spartinivicinus ruber]
MQNESFTVEKLIALKLMTLHWLDRRWLLARLKQDRRQQVIYWLEQFKQRYKHLSYQSITEILAEHQTLFVGQINSQLIRSATSTRSIDDELQGLPLSVMQVFSEQVSPFLAKQLTQQKMPLLEITEHTRETLKSIVMEVSSQGEVIHGPDYS